MLLLSALRVSGLDLWVRRLSRFLGLGVILFSHFFLQGGSWSVTDRIWSHVDTGMLTYFSLFLLSLTYFPLSLRLQVSHKGLTSSPLSLCLLHVPIWHYFRNTHLQLFVLSSTICSREILPFYTTNILIWGKKLHLSFFYQLCSVAFEQLSWVRSQAQSQISGIRNIRDYI